MAKSRCVSVRKTRVEYEQGGRRLPCPLKWLDGVSIRNFTNASVFDHRSHALVPKEDYLPKGSELLVKVSM